MIAASCVVVGVDRFRDEARHERHHDDAAVLRHARENRVGHVARMIDERARAGVREDHRRLGDVERGAHRPGRDVRQVDEHAEAVHLAHDFPAEWREAAVLRRVERGVGPVERHVVRERHVARAECVVRAQQGERILNRVAALEAEHRAELAVRVGIAHRVGGGRPLQLGIARDDLPRDVDLLELHARVARAGWRLCRSACTRRRLARRGCRSTRTVRRRDPP